MTAQSLAAVAQAMVAPGKGILAADESSGTIKKRFDSIKLESTAESRRAYRDMLFTTPGASEFISGVILYDETLRQSTLSGVPVPKYLAQQGMIPGIKVDAGAKPLAGFPGETVTEGLDGLRERLKEYAGLGAKFAKWRAVIAIGPDFPGSFSLAANAHALARYAALCQEAGIVPIVEPEVLMDGDHTIGRCEEVTTAALERTFIELRAHRVDFAGMVLKPNMVVPGQDCRQKASVREVAEATIRCLKATVPATVPGIAFLSGGQSPEESTEHLGAMNTLGALPWQLTFSYGRALQAPSLKAWGGKPEAVKAGQAAFLKRARLNGLAHAGQYRREMEAA
ncbi:MAG: fructose-bisphosphate aldolase class I [Chromatiales bacterium]|nr:fructose-bisphosphate aldolase class I [Chromatiales bacterium]